MAADFWASYISGALGILIGNRLDVLKVQAQAGLSSTPPTSRPASPLLPSTNTTPLPPSPIPSSSSSPSNSTPHHQRQNVPYQRLTTYFRGAAAPILGYGALNSILFVTFNRTLHLLNPGLFDYTKLAGCSLPSIWLAGALGGLATWLVSAPSELVKCRAQLMVGGQGSSWGVAREVWVREGVKGLFRGGAVTSVRDAVGYGWYFWTYELMKRGLVGRRSADWWEGMRAWEVLLAGGVAGVVTWASVYPLDVVKTRVQTGLGTGTVSEEGETRGLLRDGTGEKRRGAWRVAKEVYAEGGLRAFYRGLGVCSLRAFVVNAVQWYTYDRIMLLLGPPK
jgi:solute carrier family 25 (mitochondrial carnitine/acylcarnitine transporter), member 20/29